jgi:DNA-directed RNA polymerase specialized sigma24 family protein
MKFRSLVHKHSNYKGINWFALYTEGNRKAFSHFFELQYPGLFHATRKTLGDPGAAKKIVLGAFVNAWKQRESFTAPDHLKIFIRETVRENCASYRLAMSGDHKTGNTGIIDRSFFFADRELKGPHMERIHKEILAEMFQRQFSDHPIMNH